MVVHFIMCGYYSLYVDVYMACRLWLHVQPTQTHPPFDPHFLRARRGFEAIERLCSAESSVDEREREGGREGGREWRALKQSNGAIFALEQPSPRPGLRIVQTCI